MKSKIAFGISIVVLAASVTFSAQRIKGDEEARQLYPLVKEVADEISRNNLGEVSEYQEFIDKCNRAIERRSIGKSKKLIEQVSEVRKNVQKLGKSLKDGREQLEKYKDYPATLESIAEVETEKNLLEQNLSDLTQAVNTKNGEMIDTALKDLKKNVGLLNDKLKNQTDEAMSYYQNTNLNDPVSDAARAVCTTWYEEAQNAYAQQNYADAYVLTQQIKRFTNLWNANPNPEFMVSKTNVEGNIGKIDVIVPKTTADLDGKLDHLYITERKTDGTEVPCSVTGIQKTETEAKVNSYVMQYYRFPQYTDVLLSSYDISQLNSNSNSWLTVSQNLFIQDLGFYDAIYDVVMKASQVEGKNAVFVFITNGSIGYFSGIRVSNGSFGSSSHTVQDIIQLAQGNNVSLWVGNDFINNDITITSSQAEELKELTEKTGGCMMEGFNTSYYLQNGRLVETSQMEDYLEDDGHLRASQVAYYLASLNGQAYEIQYESSLESNESREISITMLEDKAYCAQTAFRPDKHQTQTGQSILEVFGIQNEIQQTNEETEAAVSTTDDYIFQDSSSRYLTEQEITVLSDWQKKIARNEIYARHGRKFNSEELQQYFNSKSWYVPSIEVNDFKEEMLNDIERYNTKLIKQYESH